MPNVPPKTKIVFFSLEIHDDDDDDPIRRPKF